MSDPSSSTAAAAPSGTSSADDLLRSVAAEQAQHDAQAKFDELQGELAQCRKDNERLTSEKKELENENAQLKEAADDSRTAFAALNAELRDHRTRLDIAKREQAELQADVDRLKAKGRSHDALVRELRTQAESDGETIRKLDVERTRAVYERDRFEHDHVVLKQALENARDQVQALQKISLDKDAEFGKYRNDQFAELQKATAAKNEAERKASLNDDLRAEAQRELESTTDRLRESERRVDELRRQHAQEIGRHRRRAAELQAANTNLSHQVDEARAAVDALESAVQEQRTQAAARVEELRTDFEAAEEARNDAETKLKEMAAVVERLGAAVAGGPGGGERAAATDIYGQALSATASGLSGSGRSYAEFYADYARRELELAEAKQEQSRLQGLLDAILADIDESGPRLRRQREELDEVRAEAERLHAELAAASMARQEAETACDAARTELASSSSEIKALGGQVADLTLQVRVLTRELAIQDDPQLRFEAFEDENAAAVDDDGIQAVITSNLTAFRKLPQLVEQNKRLLRISRELGNKLEDLEGRVRNTQGTTTSFSDEADVEEDDIEAALKSITSLTSEVDRLKAVLKDTQGQAQAYKKERDLFSRMIADVRVNGGEVRFEDGETDASSLEPIRKNMLEAVNKAFEDKHNSLNLTIAELQEKLSDATRDAEKARADASNALSLLRDERSQVDGLRRAQVQDKVNLEHAQQSLRDKEAELLRIQQQMHKLNEDLNSRQLDARRLQTELDMARGEKAMLESMASKANADFTTLLQEKATMAQELSTRKLVIENTATETNIKIASYESMNNSLQQDLAGLREELAKAKEAYHSALDTSKDKARVAEIESLKTRVAQLESEAKAKEEETSQKLTEFQKLVDDAKAAEARKNQIGLKFKAQMESGRAALAAKEQELADATQSLKSQVANLVAELDAAKASLATKDAELSSKQAEISALQQQQQQAQEAATEKPAEPSTELQSRIDELVKQEQDLRAQLASSESKVLQLTTELETKTRALTEAQQAPKETTSTMTTEDAERASLIEALRKDKDDLTARLASLEADLSKARSELEAARTLQQPAASGETASSGPVTESGLAELQAEFDVYKAKQEELYEKNVRQVNNANKNLVARVKRLEAAAKDAEAAAPSSTKTEEDVKVAVEEALKKQRAELQAEAESTAAAPKQEEGGVIDEQIAAIRAEYEKTISELKARITELEQQVEHWTKEYNSQKEIASKALLKASLFDKQKKAAPKAAAGQPATAPTAPSSAAAAPAAPSAPAVKANPASLPNIPPAPGANAANRGMNIAGRGRGGRGGVGRGGQVAGRPAARGGMTPAAVLAAVEAKQGKAAAPKRRASETANGDATAQQGDAGKRAKLDDASSVTKPSNDQQQPPPAT